MFEKVNRSKKSHAGLPLHLINSTGSSTSKHGSFYMSHDLQHTLWFRTFHRDWCHTLTL